MKRLAIGAALLILVGTVQAFPVKLIAYNQRTASTLSVLKWEGCAPLVPPATSYPATTGCINPTNTNLSNMGITPSTAVWDWNPTTGVLSMTGNFNSALTLGSSGSAFANTIIGDKVSNLTINTVNKTSTASAYQCAEGMDADAPGLAILSQTISSKSRLFCFSSAS